jgi:hypothetical protein
VPQEPQASLFTYYSENIEKHSKPNNTCDVYNEESYMNNAHPLFNEIKFKYLNSELNKELKQLLNEMANKSLITKGEDSYFVEDPKTQGFPRLMIRIKDKELRELATHKHLETLKQKNKFLGNTNKLKNYFDCVNDIKVSEIVDSQPQKIAFVKTLGDNNDYKERVMMYGKNKQTLFAALKRQIKTAPVPSSMVSQDFIKFSKEIIDEELGEDLRDFGYDVSQWYNHLNKEKQNLVKPIYNYYNHPEELLQYTRKEIEEILSLEYTAIVKAELQELDGKPRMICSIPQHVKYIMGPVTWMLEEIAAKKLKGYCGGLNLTEMSEQLNNYIKEGFTKVVEGDGSAFDNTQDITLKEVDRYIYNKITSKIYHVPKTIFEQVANTYYKVMNVNYRDFNNTRKVRTYLRYYVLGTVFSGDCDTTLMNTIRMVLYNRYVNEKAGLKYGKDYVVYAKGDDFSVLYKDYISNDTINKIYYSYFLPSSNSPDIITDKRQYGIGQVLKFLSIGDPSTFRFCSLRSWYKEPFSEEITLTRDPKTLYNKAIYSVKYKSYNKRQQYLYHLQQAISYQVNYGGIEIFDIIAKAHFNKASEIRMLYNIKLSKKQRKKALNVEEKLLKRKERKENIEFTQDEELNELLSKLYDVKKREKYIDFYTNYWEQMQLVERQRCETNTILELQYINDQINAEFDTEELKSLLALQ